MSSSRLTLLRCTLSVAALVFVVLASANRGDAQQNVFIETPYQSMSDHFYEYIGSSWGYRNMNANGGGFFFNNGGFGPPPPFGGFDGSGARFGFGGGGNGSRFRFNMVMAQGSSRSYTATAPSVTMIPGAGGAVYDMRLRPFVTGYIPVVGGFAGRPPTVHRPSWDRGKVAESLAKYRQEKAETLRKEEAQATQFPLPTRQDDDPPLRLGQ